MSRDDGRPLRGVVKNGAIVLDASVSLPEGTHVLITIASGAVGSPQAVLNAIAASPRVEIEDVAALLREIEGGKRPVHPGFPLD